MRLGIDAKQADQTGPRIDRAAARYRQVAARRGLRQGRFGRGRPRQAGATEVGGEEMAKKIKEGWTDFDVLHRGAGHDGYWSVLSVSVLGPRG